jgi:glucose-1-phosphate thymidylyltransferase
MKRKGIILAGGSGTRMHPLTHSISKQLLPVYDRPMIYYPLSTLMLADIRDILLISTSADMQSYQKLLGDGESLGINIKYAIQDKPNGLAQALIIAEKFLDGLPCALILGDNIFHGDNLEKKLLVANGRKNGATIFACSVKDPERYGIVNFDKSKNIISLIEKPKKPKSKYAVTGLYFFDEKASFYAKKIKPSNRNELEITDLNNIYLKKNNLKLEIFDESFIWFDAGTHESLLEASQYFYAFENRKGKKIYCPEEISLLKGWIDKKKLKEILKKYGNNNYKKYLDSL